MSYKRGREEVVMNYIQACTIDDLPKKMSDGGWWLIHVHGKTSFWESWGVGNDPNAQVRSGKIGKRGFDERLGYQEVLEEVKERLQKGYCHNTTARVPVRTQMMPGGYARTISPEHGSYGVTDAEDVLQVVDEPPASMPRIPPPPPKKKVLKPKPKFKKPDGSEEAFRRIALEREQREKQEEQHFAAAERKRRKKKEDEINSMKELMNQRKKESEW